MKLPNHDQDPWDQIDKGPMYDDQLDFHFLLWDWPMMIIFLLPTITNGDQDPWDQLDKGLLLHQQLRVTNRDQEPSGQLDKGNMLGSVSDEGPMNCRICNPSCLHTYLQLAIWLYSQMKIDPLQLQLIWSGGMQSTAFNEPGFGLHKKLHALVLMTRLW